MALLGTVQAHAEQSERFALQRRLTGDDIERLGIGQAHEDAVPGDRRQVGEEGLEAVHRQARRCAPAARLVARGVGDLGGRDDGGARGPGGVRLVVVELTGLLSPSRSVRTHAASVLFFWAWPIDLSRRDSLTPVSSHQSPNELRKPWPEAGSPCLAYAGSEETETAAPFSSARFEPLCQGFFSAFGKIEDIARYAAAPAYMSFMLAARFLTDHPENDVYFKVTRHGDNLARAGSQLDLAKRFLAAEADMAAIIEACSMRPDA